MKKTNNIYFVLISFLLMAGCGKVEPTIEPTEEPTVEPTPVPSEPEASVEPTTQPTVIPSEPTIKPTVEVTPEITAEPTPEPTAEPSIDDSWPYGNLSLDISLFDFSFTQENIVDDALSATVYDEFLKNGSSSELIIPALNQYFVPQGLSYWEEFGWFFITGYFKPTDYSASSVLLAIDSSTGEYVGEWNLLDVDETPHTKHDGGIAITETDIYLSTSYTLYRISIDHLYEVGNVGDLQIEEEIKVPVSASFANYSNNMVWVGEFYEKNDYPLRGLHEIQINDNLTHYAWVAGYNLDKNTNKIEDTPTCILSIPEKIQGMSFLRNKTLVLSSSYGRRNYSSLYFVNDPLSKEYNEYVTINDKEVPMYYIDNYDIVVAPPMVEGCCSLGNTLYMIFETAAYNYLLSNPSNVSKDPLDEIWMYTKK